MKYTKTQKILLISGIIQLIIAISYYFNARLFPGPSCRLYNDCVGQAMTYSFVAFPIGLLGIINLILVYFEKLHKLSWLIIIWLSLTWLYVIYWVIIPLIFTILNLNSYNL
jgi:hypothetical protein